MRSIADIAYDIRKAWAKPSPYALPYLQHMLAPWGHETARDAALYFLSNANGWRGDDARRLKAELKAAIAR
jgi:hypothetical protein